jgi:hypothetical protein
MFTAHDILTLPLSALIPRTPPKPRCSTSGCGDPTYKDSKQCYYCDLGEVIETYGVGLPRRR